MGIIYQVDGYKGNTTLQLVVVFFLPSTLLLQDNSVYQMEEEDIDKHIINHHLIKSI